MNKWTWFARGYYADEIAKMYGRSIGHLYVLAHEETP